MKGQLEGDIPSTKEEQNVDTERLVDASSVNMEELESSSGFRRGGSGGTHWQS